MIAASLTLQWTAELLQAPMQECTWSAFPELALGFVVEGTFTWVGSVLVGRWAVTSRDLRV